MQELGLINIPELSPAAETFVSLRRYAELPWHRLSGQPQGWLERKITRPKLARYRAALQAAWASHRFAQPVVVSHLPMMSAAVAQALRIGRRNARHMAFAFNYTELPQGRRKSYFARSFERVDRFVVFSAYERDLYAAHFGIPAEKIRTVLWTQNAPPVDTDIAPPFAGNYLCAIGGEGRDFACLLEAARTSKVPLVIVARPHSLAGLAVPDTVKLFCNLPLAQTWGLAARSAGVIVPLLAPETCCGQITVVSAQMLGLPLITNQCHALRDYLGPHDLVFPSGAAAALAQTMVQLHACAGAEPAAASVRAQAAAAKYDRSLWAACIEDFLDECRQEFSIPSSP